MKSAIRAIIAVIVIAAAIVAAGHMHLLDTVYEKLAGPADLGPIAFERLTREGDDALACPPGECGSARADMRAEAYPVTAVQLRQRTRRYFALQGAVMVASDDTSLHDRFVARTFLLHLPCTIDVAFFALDAEHATLAVYSRGRPAWLDFGANLRHVRALLETLGPGVASAAIDVWRG